MNKGILITQGCHAFNQAIASRMLAGGHRVVLHTAGPGQAAAYRRELEEEAAARLYILEGDPTKPASLQAMMEESIHWLDSLDVMIHGDEMYDEEQMMMDRPEEFGHRISAVFEEIFLWNQAAVQYMVKKKRGKIIFPIRYDTLYYDGYPSSPVVNHGKISMMKCLSRECSVFRIDVNVMSFGYHDTGWDRAGKKEMQRKLEIFGLKPALKPLEDMLGMLEYLIQAPGSLVGGQNLEIGIGIETNL